MTLTVVTVASPAQAVYLATLPALLDHGYLADFDGATVTLCADALEVLADFDEHEDGRFDGLEVWVCGVGYPVVDVERAQHDQYAGVAERGAVDRQAARIRQLVAELSDEEVRTIDVRRIVDELFPDEGATP